jgi:hypothetical protein
MGEKKRRAEAFGDGRPWRPPLICPDCKSPRVSRTTILRATALSRRPTEYACCRACGTAWEAYPADWCEDVVGAAPCDNCAFRPGSPEQADPEHWKWLVGQLRAGQEFRCHKGAPIRNLHAAPDAAGNVAVEFDKDWVQKHGRKCAGFMRMVWQMREKGEDWVARHFEFVGAPGYDCEPPPGTGSAE